MVSGLINANPVVYEKKERRLRNLATLPDEYAVEPIDQQEIFDILFLLFLLLISFHYASYCNFTFLYCFYISKLTYLEK